MDSGASADMSNSEGRTTLIIAARGPDPPYLAFLINMSLFIETTLTGQEN
jgi:hypothetical protein